MGLAQSAVPSGGIGDSTASRVLAFGGISLILAGMIFGDLFAIFVLHQNNARIGEAMYRAALAIPSGDVDTILGSFQALGGFLENRGTKIDAHNHAVLLGYIAVLLAVLQPFVGWSERTRLRLAWLYVINATILPIAVFLIHYVGLAYSPSEVFGWASIVTQPTAFLVGLVVVWQLLGLLRAARSASPVCLESVFQVAAPGPARVLLLGGSLLVLIGVLYGAAFAAYVGYFLSPTEPQVLHEIIAVAAAGQPLEPAFDNYGGVLAFRGIHVAAHAHVNAVGILMFLMAFIQPGIFLSERWKLRWAWLLVVSGFALPASILLEFALGRVAGGIADFWGGVAILALVAMLVGLVRGSGARDSGGGVRHAR